MRSLAVIVQGFFVGMFANLLPAARRASAGWTRG